MSGEGADRPLIELAQDIGQRLAEVYLEIYRATMRDLPICNHALGVETIGFRPHAGHVIGVVVTPWFMNLVAVSLPDEALPAIAKTGIVERLALPAGDVDFISGTLLHFGGLLSCSIFSPMFDFSETKVARATAEATLAALFDPEFFAPEMDTAERKPTLDRRAFLRGRFASETGEP